MRSLRAFVAAAAIVSGSLAAMAHADTVNTYSFTQGGYLFDSGPESLSGTFTATISPLGHVDLSDLSAISLGFGGDTSVGLSSVSLFSFNSDHLSDLAMVANDGPLNICVGLPAIYLPTCNPSASNPPDTFGFYGLPVASQAYSVLSNQAPVVTLVSSVTRPSASTEPAAVPEPATWAMILVGFGAIGFATRTRVRKGLASQWA